MLKKTLALLITSAVLGTLFALTGCNTIAGAGTDVQQTGEAIHDSAKDVQRKM